METLSVLFDLRLNKLLSKQSWGWWFETLSCPLWRHCNAGVVHSCYFAYTSCLVFCRVCSWFYPCPSILLHRHIGSQLPQYHVGTHHITTNSILQPQSFKISARPRNRDSKILVGLASFPSLSYINFGKIVHRSGKFQILFWRLQPCTYVIVYYLHMFPCPLTSFISVSTHIPTSPGWPVLPSSPQGHLLLDLWPWPCSHHTCQSAQLVNVLPQEWDVM